MNRSEKRYTKAEVYEHMFVAAIFGGLLTVFIWMGILAYIKDAVT